MKGEVVLGASWTLGTMASASTAEVGSQWHMVSALEAMDGALLFGISTAFIFTVMQDYWPMLSRGGPSLSAPRRR
jgi:hypothetical protein